MIVLGAVAAILVQSLPAVGLGFPALMLINAVFFHIVPFVHTRGRFSPGLITAVILFLPLGLGCYWQALHEGMLGAATTVVSLLIGAALMAAPVVLLSLRGKPYFRQDR